MKQYLTIFEDNTMKQTNTLTYDLVKACRDGYYDIVDTRFGKRMDHEGNWILIDDDDK